MLKLMKNVNFFCIFSRLVPFPQLFRQLKEWLMLELHNIIRMSHVVVCPIIFYLFIFNFMSEVGREEC